MYILWIHFWSQPYILLKVFLSYIRISKSCGHGLPNSESPPTLRLLILKKKKKNSHIVKNKIHVM